MSNKRTFVVVDGPDFSGKSTLMKAFLARIEQEQIPFVAIREPGSVDGAPSLAEEVRATLIAKRDEVVHPETDVLLHMGYRIQNVKNVIKPALDEGKWVVSDRFIFSTWCLNVQANLPTHPHLVEMFYGLMPYVLKGIPEPLTFILDTPREIRDARAASDERKKDRYESQAKDVHDRIEAAYDQLRSAPSCVFLDGTKSTEELVEQMLVTVKAFSEELQDQLESEQARTEVVEERKLTADERMQEVRNELDADESWDLDTKCHEYVRDHITIVADRLFPGAEGEELVKYTKDAEEFSFKAAKAVFLKSGEDRTIFHPSRIGQINQKVHSVLNFSFMKEQWNELFDREGIKPAE
jgi:dTMP kinase